MSVSVVCSECGESYSVPRSRVGESVACPVCGAANQVVLDSPEPGEYTDAERRGLRWVGRALTLILVTSGIETLWFATWWPLAMLSNDLHRPLLILADSMCLILPSSSLAGRLLLVRTPSRSRTRVLAILNIVSPVVVWLFASQRLETSFAVRGFWDDGIGHAVSLLAAIPLVVLVARLARFLDVPQARTTAGIVLAISVLACLTGLALDFDQSGPEQFQGFGGWVLMAVGFVAVAFHASALWELRRRAFEIAGE